MKKRYIVIAAALCLLLALGVGLGPKVYRAVRVWNMVQELLSAETGSLDVSVDIDGEETAQADFRMDWQDVGQKRVYILNASGAAVYFCQGTIYLENGKGYAFGEAIADVSRFAENPWLLYPLVQIDREGGAWTVNLEAGQLLEELGAVTVDLEEDGGILERICVFAWLDPKDGDMLSAYGRIRRDRDVLEIPAAVLDAVERGEVQGGADLTQDMLRLVQGWAKRNAEDPLTMELALSADCGVLSVSDTLNVYRTMVDGTAISYVENPGFWGLYFTDKAVCTAEGTLLTSQGSGVEAAQLLGLAYQLCFNGEVDCQGDVYRLTLDQAGMEAVAYAIAPQARELNIGLTEGSLELTMQGSTIEKISFRCGGTVDLLVTQVDAAIGAELVFTEAQTGFTVPQAVINALIN